MAKIWYAVRATLPNSRVADEYVQWLSGGHIQQVCVGGAESAAIVRLERDAGDGLPESALQVLTQYTFGSREVFDRYVNDHAPALRADGLRLFGPERGVRFERLVGEVVG